MTARLPQRLRDRSATARAAQPPASPHPGAEPYNPAWDIDMIGDSRMEYDGPRCADDDCDEPVDHDGETCGDCTPCRCCGGVA